MLDTQRMYNEVNAVIHFLPECDKRKLPYELIKYFRENANCKPEDAVDMEKELKDQDFADETLLVLYRINNLLKE